MPPLPVPEIEPCPGPSDTGAYRIAWTVPATGGTGEASFRLAERRDGGEETVVYEGAQAASTVTGRQAGVHVYRVAVVGSGEQAVWSAPCEVTVAPPSMSMALLFFTVGLAITGATVGLIVGGHRAHRKGEIG